MPYTVRKSVDQRWQEQFERLVEFKRAHGHSLMSPKHPPDKSLGNWVAIRRGKFKHGRLKPEYEKKLRKIGFPFNLNDATWETMYEQLLKYREQNDDRNVPNKYAENPKLGLW